MAAFAWVVAALAGVAFAGGAARATEPQRLRNGVEVWTLAGPGDGLIDVAVQLGGGLAADAEHPGQAAALASLLLRGPSAAMEVGGFERAAHRAGLGVEVSITWHSVTLHLLGPQEALPTALWLLTDRLRPALDAAPFGEALQESMFVGAERSRQTAVGRFGAPADMLMAAMLGESEAQSPLASRIAARQLTPEALESLALDARATAPVRVFAAVPESLAPDAARTLAQRLGALTGRVAPRAVLAVPAERPRTDAVAPLEFPNPLDDATRLVLAWDLRGVAHALRLSAVDRDALMLTVRAWLDHAGSTPHARLTDERVVAHAMEVELHEEGLLALVVTLTVRGVDVRDARAALTGELSRLAESPPPEAEIRGAAALAAAELRQRLSSVAERARLADTLTSTGRAAEGGVDGWMEAMELAFARVDGAAVAAFAAWAFHADRLAEARVVKAGDANGGPDVDADVLGTYLRIMVDLRCPAPGQTGDVVEVLKLKYGMEARGYVLLTRAIAQRPALMRQLTEDAELRCAELTKLRELLPRAKALELHEAVTCGPGRLPVGARRDEGMAALFRRFKVDPSWYGPLVGMLREEVGAARAMDAVEARCPAAVAP